MQTQYEVQKEKVIAALDVPTANDALRAVDELRGEVGAFKVGLQLFTSAGASLVEKLVRQEVRVFLDVKYHDIPNQVASASVEAARLGVWMFNVHSSGGGEMMSTALEKMSETCEKESLDRPKLIAVTVLTSSNKATLQETGITQEVDQRVLQLAQLAAKCGLDGVVASPLETRLIRERIKKLPFDIVTPGIRPSDATSDDQKRVMTPAQAVAAGSDYLVIGRPILKAADKAAAARTIIEEMANAADSIQLQ
ncbi:MAG: orotidine-5'-phosphate decarboxylase [Acidobacteria bacterium]|nr:MAG: orotidine-5'-phosphate decarboxylase [Acidobacteriota bacterium]REK03109.1 MAG: orotidine-5'-phosphate decarboxylase [Acidobacteriota bacterium]REK15457.1 MAG: orotidine-5'-phosphate decarboxylase [Acidobacteriota bacterium]REK45807.1 MAG: orotidine-5'-phosphate decarboxylase [Acidobacteriota bacterium]